jgi:hypothetical protein
MKSNLFSSAIWNVSAVSGRTIRKQTRGIGGKSVGFVHAAFQAKKPPSPEGLGKFGGRQRLNFTTSMASGALVALAVPSRNPIHNVVRALSENRGIIRRDACHPVQYLFAICSSRGGGLKPKPVCAPPTQ